MSELKMVEDLGAAAYIMMHKFKVIGKRGRSVVFELEEKDDVEQFDKLYKEYLNSEYHRFDSCLMSLKKLREITAM